MKTVIKFIESVFDETRSHLLQGSEEEAAFLLAGVSKSESRLTLLVKETILVPNSGFIKKSGLYLEISPEFMAPVIKKARLGNLAVISLHSHPFSSSSVGFSGIDDHGEALLMSKIQQRVPNIPHATMVFGTSSVDARIWLPGNADPIPVDEIKLVGCTIREVYPTSSSPSAATDLAQKYNRQILAFGRYGQKRLHQVKAGIVGLSGTGSHVFQQLVHLGVRSIAIVDFDIVKDVNLPRIPGATKKDVENGTLKIEVMRRLAAEVDPTIAVEVIDDSIENCKAARKLRDVDVIFCCTDNLASRLVLNRLAFQYLIPLIDLGIDIQVTEEGKIRTAGGRVMVITPDKPCLSCLGIIKAENLQREKDAQTGYVTGENVPDPSVISLNGVIASLAVTEFIDLLTAFERRKGANTYQLYDILRGQVWRQELSLEQPCGVCSEIKGLGDNESLPCRDE